MKIKNTVTFRETETKNDQPTDGMISRKMLEEFKQIHRRQYGKDISDQKATDLAINLVMLYKRIYRPIPKNHDANN